MGETEKRVSIKERRRQSQNQNREIAGMLGENKKMMILFCVIVAILAVLLISILGLRVAAIPVCVMVLIEMAMSFCLQDVPIWLHGLVVIVQVITGAWIGAIALAMLCAAIYLVGILSLRLLRE
ncbi:MAG: hypothetical protein PUB98_00150 [Clostridiales bacterium]|nr:hypothetical protein [Clostridiales bacterium]